MHSRYNKQDDAKAYDDMPSFSSYNTRGVTSRAKLGPSSSSESRYPEGKGNPAYILVTELVSKLGSKGMGTHAVLPRPSTNLTKERSAPPNPQVGGLVRLVPLARQHGELVFPTSEEVARRESRRRCHWWRSGHNAGMG